MAEHPLKNGTGMATLHVVSDLSAGYAREDASSAAVIGAYTNAEVALAVKRVCGSSAQVHRVEVDFIPKELANAMQEFGNRLPDGR
jgi:hypothetical protein